MSKWRKGHFTTSNNFATDCPRTCAQLVSIKTRTSSLHLPWAPAGSLPGANCVDSGEADAERPRLDRIRVSLDGPTHTVHVFSCETVKHDRLCKLKRLQDKLATLTISHVL